MLSGIGALAALAVAQRDGGNLQARFANRADNKAAMDRFREAATKHQDVESLLKDRRNLQVVLEAFQLEGEIDKRGILRKILTEDPAAEGSLANRLTDRRWRELAGAFAARTTVALTTTQMAALSTTQLQGLALNQMAGLSAEQAQALGTAQIASLDAAHVAALGTAALSGLDLVDIAALGTAQIAALRPSQMAALGVLQVASIETGDIKVLSTAQIRALGTAQLRGLGSAQLRALSTTQLAALTTTQIGALTTLQKSALTTTQAAALGTSAAAAIAAARLDLPVEAGRTPLGDPALLERVVSGAITNRYEKAMGDDNAGLREALYFIRNAGKVTSIVELMTDKAMTTVVRGALGLPESFGALDFEQQKALLTRRVKLEEFQDPKAVAKMAGRYVALSASSQSSSSPVLALFNGGSGLNSLIGLSIKA